jgi:putative DNA methylase
MSSKSFIEVQFPIGPLSLEAYKERKANHAQVLKPLGKWWGEKPMVLTRAIVLGCLLPTSEDPGHWADDLDIFLRCMCLDNAGMWKRKIKVLPATLCYCHASVDEQEELFESKDRWWRGADRELKEALERRVFYTLGHTEQREYCCRVEEIEGPPEESWEEINTYLGTSANTQPELVQQLAERRFGTRLKVGDAFCGMGSIPFEAAELGCDVYASDLNPVACLLTWGALNIVGGSDEFRTKIHSEQRRIYDEVDTWILEQGIETSEEGWRGETYFYCSEVLVPGWDDWQIPVCPRWIISRKNQLWINLVPLEPEKRFTFALCQGGEGYEAAEKGTKQGPELVCPAPLWELFKRQRRNEQMQRSIRWNDLVKGSGGLRRWVREDFSPRKGDLLQERLYCIKWKDTDGNAHYREPHSHDLDMEQKIVEMLNAVFKDWQRAGWIPSWRIEPGEKTNEPIRTRGWTYWHHLFNPRQLLITGRFGKTLAESKDDGVKPALLLSLGKMLNQNAKLCSWDPLPGIEKTHRVYYNQALNTLFSYGARGFIDLRKQIVPHLHAFRIHGRRHVVPLDVRQISERCHLWITDPPYADAVNYEELSEFFLAWYVPHLKTVFPEWYIDSMRARAVKGNDAPFRTAMAECYRRLAEHMPDDGIQVLMFTHKSTDVWEDLALIMWAAGLQVKQVWSIATETPGAGIRTGNYVQATYNMILRKRTGNKMGFIDFITPQVNKRVREVITHMRESQVEGGLTRCGYTDTDYLLAAQAAAAEVVTGYASIDGVDLEAELRTPNAERGRSALRTLMDNAKRTATDFLVPPAMGQAIRKASGGNAYPFWREFSPEEKFLLKGLELETQGVFKIGAFQDLGRAYGLSDYESLLGPTKANDTRTKLPEELPRPDAVRFDDVPAAERALWRYSPVRHIYHALKLLQSGADIERAVKHLVDSTDFWNIRTTRLAVILSYLREITGHLPHWALYQNYLAALEIGVEHWKA